MEVGKESELGQPGGNREPLGKSGTEPVDGVAPVAPRTLPRSSVGARLCPVLVSSD
jgi:hypothetical protein